MGCVLRVSPMESDNADFQLEMHFEEVAKFQYFRELTQNSIDSITEAVKSGLLTEASASMKRRLKKAQAAKLGLISWDVNWKLYNLEEGSSDLYNYLLKYQGIYKMACIDNGTGMLPSGLKKLKRLYSTSRTQSRTGNFGIGAKIAALPSNPEGLLYCSWVDGVGHMALLMRHPETGKYGLKEWEWEDGRVELYIPIDDSWKPEGIDQHGTIVTLLGKFAQQNTMEPPDGEEVSTETRWTNRILNQRRFRYPEMIRVETREKYHLDDDKRHNTFRVCRGQEAFLNGIDTKGRPHYKAKGIVQLTGAKVHWWIIDPDSSVYGYHYYSTGHFALIYQDELYDITEERLDSYNRLRQFGCVYEQKWVIIYLEPESTEDGFIAPNSSRTKLIMKSASDRTKHGKSLVISKWAEEFRNNKPKEFSDYQDLAGSTSKKHADYREQIYENIDQVRHLFSFGEMVDSKTPTCVVELIKFVKVVPGDSTENSTETGQPVDGTNGGKPVSRPPREPGEKRPTSPDGDKNPPGCDTRTGKAGTDGLHPVPPDVPLEKEKKVFKRMKLTPPQAVWKSVAPEDGDLLRDPKEMEHGAAIFDPDHNVITVNADFLGFTNMSKDFLLQYPDHPKVVRKHVRSAFEQQLVETVLFAQGYRLSTGLTGEEAMERWLNEGSLTAAVFACQRVHEAIVRLLTKELGSPVNSPPRPENVIKMP